MSKRTNAKGRQSQASPPSRKDKAASARPAGALEPRAASAADTSAALTGGKRQTGPSQEQIAARAYQLWEAQWKPEGSNQKNWFEAERQLRAETPQPKG